MALHPAPHLTALQRHPPPSNHLFTDLTYLLFFYLLTYLLTYLLPYFLTSLLKYFLACLHPNLGRTLEFPNLGRNTLISEIKGTYNSWVPKLRTAPAARRVWRVLLAPNQEEAWRVLLAQGGGLAGGCTEGVSPCAAAESEEAERASMPLAPHLPAPHLLPAEAEDPPEAPHLPAPHLPAEASLPLAPHLPAPHLLPAEASLPLAPHLQAPLADAAACA